MIENHHSFEQLKIKVIDKGSLEEVDRVIHFMASQIATAVSLGMLRLSHSSSVLEEDNNSWRLRLVTARRQHIISSEGAILVSPNADLNVPFENLEITIEDDARMLAYALNSWLRGKTLR